MVPWKWISESLADNPNKNLTDFWYVAALPVLFTSFYLWLLTILLQGKSLYLLLYDCQMILVFRRFHNDIVLSVRGDK